MKKILFAALFGLLSVTLFSFKATPTAEKIQWLTLEQAYEKIQKEPRKIMVDVYTDWCGWCKVMDQKTFSTALVADYIGKKYYAVKFDAESTADVKIGTQVFKYDAQQKVHQAAIALLKGQMSYPTVVFLDEKMSMIQPVPGFRESKQFHQLITWFGGDYHKKEQLETYSQATYVKLFPKVQ